MLALVLQWRFLLLQTSLLLLLGKAMISWSMAVFALLLLAKVYQLRRQQAVWSNTLVNLLALLFVGALVLFARQLGVMNLMIHLLMLSAVLRLLTLPSERATDWLQLIWVHYFLLACVFLLHQQLWLAVATFAVMLLNVSCQYLWFARTLQALNWSKNLQTAALCLALTALLFVFFPRLAPLWQLPGSTAAKTGLSDEIAVGQIANLLQSEELAFRVAFDGTKPSSSDLYFRAKVYEQFDGERWTIMPNRNAQLASPPPPVPPNRKTDWQYQVIAEAHQQRHLFSLGWSMPDNARAQLGAEWLLRSSAPLTQRLSYQVRAFNSSLPATGNPRRALQLPAGNPQTRALAARLQTQIGSRNAHAMVNQLSVYLRSQPFRYSLSPGEMRGQQIDVFLFERQQGFCAHYAQAAVFVLRAAGYPARLIGGYAGGSWQDDGSYLQVKQSDAHAWVEYLQDGYWHRFDPTALIAPDLFSRNQTTNNLTGTAGQQALLWQRLQLLVLLPLQHLDYYWSSWILSFDQDNQQQLLQQLQSGLRQIDWRYAVAVMLNLSCFGLTIWLYLRKNQPLSATKLLAPVFKHWPKSNEVSVTEHLLALQQRYPAAKQQLQLLTLLYQRWQFNDERALTAQLKTAATHASRAMKQGS